jgi:hypothetical protein
MEIARRLILLSVWQFSSKSLPFKENNFPVFSLLNMELEIGG